MLKRRRRKRLGKKKESSPRSSGNDYRPPDYKPSWNPNHVCTGCGQKLGFKLMPVISDGIELHYECMLRYFRERNLEGAA